MFVGLVSCFFLTHRRIWLRISPGTHEDRRILLCGDSNKNKPAFGRRFRELIDRLEQIVA